MLFMDLFSFKWSCMFLNKLMITLMWCCTCLLTSLCHWFIRSSSLVCSSKVTQSEQRNRKLFSERFFINPWSLNAARVRSVLRVRTCRFLTRFSGFVSSREARAVFPGDVGVGLVQRGTGFSNHSHRWTSLLFLESSNCLGVGGGVVLNPG